MRAIFPAFWASHWVSAAGQKSRVGIVCIKTDGESMIVSRPAKGVEIETKNLDKILQTQRLSWTRSRKRQIRIEPVFYY